jgi:hypothetical protein
VRSQQRLKNKLGLDLARLTAELYNFRFARYPPGENSYNLDTAEAVSAGKLISSSCRRSIRQHASGARIMKRP